MEGLVGLVFAIALFSILMGTRRDRRDAPAPRRVGPPQAAPRLDPWPYPTVPGLVVQPEANTTHLRIALEALKARWRTELAADGGPDDIADALLDMAKFGAKHCSLAGVPDLARRFELLGDRILSRQGGMRGITPTESQAAMEEMKLLLGTVAAVASRRYVG